MFVSIIRFYFSYIADYIILIKANMNGSDLCVNSSALMPFFGGMGNINFYRYKRDW